MNLYEYDDYLRKRDNVKVIVGVDEAGRGPLAGDVYAAAVILSDDIVIDGINDSKKLSEKKREKLFDEICMKTITYSIGVASVDEIEKINILNASMLAMKRAVDAIKCPYEIVYTDGNKSPILSSPSKTIVKGDALSASIAAASIIAKVSRDRYMAEMDAAYPEYGFAKHKGYGTAEHREMIKKYGICPIHRPSFLKKIISL
ncbi:MAG: ribonuclease HII [Ruminococcus sp.]|jgi:ribonuclease HII|nr:ribonuclease HII [Ruminococcus sp.]